MTAVRSALDHHRWNGFWPRAAVVAGGFLLAGVTASSDDGPVLCPLRRCSGGYCPGCGLTRATGYLIRGDLRASVATHPFLVVLVAQLGALVATRAIGGQRVDAWFRARWVPVLVINAVLLVGIWVARMATGAIPIPFAA